MKIRELQAHIKEFDHDPEQKHHYFLKLIEEVVNCLSRLGKALQVSRQKTQLKEQSRKSSMTHSIIFVRWPMFMR